MIYTWKKFPREIIEEDDVTESGFNHKKRRL